LSRREPKPPGLVFLARESGTDARRTACCGGAIFRQNRFEFYRIEFATSFAGILATGQILGQPHKSLKDKCDFGGFVSAVGRHRRFAQIFIV